MKKLLPPVLPSTGVVSKPSTCSLLCPYYTVGEGFTEDILPANAMILLLVASPSGDDLINRRPLSGKAGFSFFRNYIYPLGYTENEVGVASLLRCRPAGNGGRGSKSGMFPTGFAKTATIQACRFYDRTTGGKYGVIERFDPDLYIITQDLKSTYSEPAFTRLLQRDLKKAFDLAVKGFRPIVLMGNEASTLIAPFIDGAGGSKSWRSHWDFLPDGWPHLSLVPHQKPSPFKSARY